MLGTGENQHCANRVLYRYEHRLRWWRNLAGPRHCQSARRPQQPQPTVKKDVLVKAQWATADTQATKVYSYLLAGSPVAVCQHSQGERCITRRLLDYMSLSVLQLAYQQVNILRKILLCCSAIKLLDRLCCSAYMTGQQRPLRADGKQIHWLENTK